jgi:uncharacterized protein YqeY
MSILETLKADLKTAMREKDIVKRDTIRLIMSAVKQIEVDERREVTETDLLKILQKAVKQREDAIGFAKEGNRDDLIEQNEKEIAILKEYLPKQLSDDELKEALKAIIDEVGATSMKDMGKVMGVASKKLSGQADGKRINLAVKEILS